MNNFKVGDKVVKPWTGMYPDFIYEIVEADMPVTWHQGKMARLRKFASVDGRKFKNPKATFVVLQDNLQPAKQYLQKQIDETLKLLEEL